MLTLGKNVHIKFLRRDPSWTLLVRDVSIFLVLDIISLSNDWIRVNVQITCFWVWSFLMQDVLVNNACIRVDYLEYVLWGATFFQTLLTRNALSNKLPIIVFVNKLHHDSNPLTTPLLMPILFVGFANVSARISLYVMMLLVFLVCCKHVNLQCPCQLVVPPL